MLLARSGIGFNSRTLSIMSSSSCPAFLASLRRYVRQLGIAQLRLPMSPYSGCWKLVIPQVSTFSLNVNAENGARASLRSWSFVCEKLVGLERAHVLLVEYEVLEDLDLLGVNQGGLPSDVGVRHPRGVCRLAPPRALTLFHEARLVG